ncbi:metallophosphoesterase [Proteiniphilum acetatigenes]|uniref:metallophosphoesterase n=1 Tax=Proteiniphilum acetatigenes TaxID=294710 RepID=UPI00036BA8D3|nr:metallophosphoesterase [Proteiniphilum acetatigenes]
MKIGIIHLTDLHIKETNNWIQDKIAGIVSALHLDFSKIDKIFIIISGDIANKGKGYNEAETILTKFKNSLERFIEDTSFEYILVPGNHDCNFHEPNQVRDIIIDNVHSAKYNEDNSIIDTCIKVQDDFWTFYKKIKGEIPSNKLVYQIKREIDGSYIQFTCYNTAWMSSIKENVGKMYFPLTKIPDDFSCEGNILNLSIFHHPLNWFTPNTEPNNRKAFTQHLEKNSQILIYGHEHEEEHIKNQDLKTKKETIYISGKALQSEDEKSSGFKSIVIDILEKSGIIKEYNWDKDKYICNFENNFSINGAKNIDKTFKPKQGFIDKLDSLDLPLKFENRKNIHLSDIFVFPDLERISTKEKRIDDVYNSKRLLEESRPIISLEGDAQSGKTSLLNMLYLNFLDKYKYPILLDAKNLMKYEENKTIKKLFEEQYEVADFEAYLQYDKEKKILIIDNLQNFTYNAATLINIIKNLQLHFSQIIIGTTSIFTFSSALNAEFKEINYYYIQPLGYKKRNELIEKYHLLNESPQTYTDQIILEKTKIHFDQIQTVLGNKLIPSYPVYVLSILQTLIYATPHNLEQTSLGYCYQSLIYVALTDKAKIKNEDIDSYFNFLSELAFNLYQTNMDSFSGNYLDEFYRLYNQKYVAKNLTKIKDNLIISNILTEDDDGDYKFRYNYIFYFLISRKLVELIHQEEGKRIITDLCNNLSDEKAANILVLTTHHSKDDFLIDEATLSLMAPYDNYTPITLHKDDDYYNQIEGIVRDISSNIIQANRDPKKEREKNLEESDRINEKKNANQDNEIEKEEANELVQEMSHALKAIEIVGQIVKNRKGSIDKEKLKEIITELYYTAFRTITFFGEISKFTQNELIESLKNRIEEGDSNQEIVKKINKFFQYMTFQQCIGIFSKMIYCVGNKDLKDIFDEVAKEINTPAAKLVTFSIKSAYSKLSIKELRELSKEFEDNHVAFSILRARARAYVYNNHIDYKEKQQIANSLKMKMLSK